VSDSYRFKVGMADWHTPVYSVRKEASNHAVENTVHESPTLGIDLTAGEHLVIVGSSGCGKSTLLRKLADSAELSKQNGNGFSVGLLMQEGALLDHLNVRQNLELIIRHANTNKSHVADLAELTDSLKLDPEILDKKVGELSGGQIRRIAIARALLLKPQVLLYDEPDAGLDVANLFTLASLVNSLLSTQGGQNQAAAITVSHNPIYIARTATRVAQLKNGVLETLFNWQTPANSQDQAQQRQAQLIARLSEPELATTQAALKSALKSTTTSLTLGPLNVYGLRITQFLKSLIGVLSGVLQPTRSFRDSLKVFAFGLGLSFMSGAVFFALVGLMLGATTLAVVKLLSDTALTGWISWFVNPEDILDMMGGRYALYLGPAVGTMLFAARSGGLVSNWLGERVRSRQLDGLRYLHVPVHAYMVTPLLLATSIGTALNVAWFTVAVWWGGVLGAGEFFAMTDAVSRLHVDLYDIEQSRALLKTVFYSLFSGFIVISFAFMPKTSGAQVNTDTTSAIVWSTICVALFELLIVLN